MEIGDVVGDFDALDVVPRSGADPITRVDPGFPVLRCRAQVSVPFYVLGARGIGQCRTVAISTSQSAQIRALPGPRASNKERHGWFLLLRGCVNKGADERAEQ